MKKFIKILCCFLAVISTFSFWTVYYYNTILPNNIMIYDDETVNFNTNIKIVSNKEESEELVSNINKASDSYKSDLSLMGIVPIKSININKVKKRYVVLSGENFGIKIFTKGVMVVGMSDVKGGVNPAKKAGMKIGDIILKVNNKSVNSNEELSAIINNSGGYELVCRIKRNNKTFNITFKPIYSKDNASYKAGIWVRDSSAGLGTMTFYSLVNGAFAGLGHGIVDVDTGVLLPINSGEIVKTEILSITKSNYGSAGEICGAFTGEVEGDIINNAPCGLYGYLNSFDKQKELIRISNRQDVKEGKARIYTTLDNNGPKYYNCEIEKVDYNNKTQKNLLIHITDEKLISKTGGIVQGMSGSPIVQNGQLVGALTNVFVNNPTRGYAVFSDEMYEKMTKVTENSTLNRVS
ncbi:MAG: SpoIVB peptidase [Clostridia bacterium]|nr:SpoIVB peptidase [Clostridia bacterium]